MRPDTGPCASRLLPEPLARFFAPLLALGLAPLLAPLFALFLVLDFAPLLASLLVPFLAPRWSLPRATVAAALLVLARVNVSFFGAPFGRGAGRPPIRSRRVPRRGSLLEAWARAAAKMT